MAVWTPTIARVGAFCSVFQDVHAYAAESEGLCRPLHKFSKFRENISFSEILATFRLFPQHSAISRRTFHGYLLEFLEIQVEKIHRMLGNKFVDFAEIL